MTELSPITVEAFGGNAQRATVFLDRYAMKGTDGQPVEFHPEEMWMRVARAMSDNPVEQMHFFSLLKGWKFVPGGRILAGAGTGTEVTFYNCYVIPVETKQRRQARSGPSFILKSSERRPLDGFEEYTLRRPLFLEGPDTQVESIAIRPDKFGNDSRESIIDTLGVMVDILSHGGGVGINWSTLRPEGAYLKRLNGTAGGPIGWMEVASVMVGEVEQGGSRRGAAMFMLDDWHPDLLKFVNVKRDLSKIEHANLSIAISEQFMQAVKDDGDWTFGFPDTADPHYNEEWDGDANGWLRKGYGWKTYETMKARDIWRQIAEMAWDNGEPGLVFLGRYNEQSTGKGVERLISVNPCGEQGLGPYSVCNLGSMNLAAYVEPVVEGGFRFNQGGFEEGVALAVRFLDNAIDKNFYFLPENEQVQKRLRRIGLGLMGLADALIKLGIRYGSLEAVVFTERVYRSMKDVAIETSNALAVEKGHAPAWDDEMWKRPYLADYLDRHGPYGVEKIEAGLRNIFLLTQAPTGTTSIVTGVSSGLEPWFDVEGYWRNDRTGQHWVQPQSVVDAWPEGTVRPDYVVDANEVTIEEHVAMQAAAQRYIDSSISKTVNAPKSHTVEDVEGLYMLAYDSGLKGIAYFRTDCGRAQVLSRGTKAVESTESADRVAELLLENQRLEEQLASVVPFAAKRKRPVVAKGTTRRIKTTAGSAYVTVNRNDDGEPFEVFVNVGKAGTDVMVMGEAIGRILSLAVKNGASLSELGSQLLGVGGFSKFQKSLPSAIGDALLAEDMGDVRIGVDLAKSPDFSSFAFAVEDENGKQVWSSNGIKEGTIELSMDLTPAGKDWVTKASQPSGQLCGDCGNYTVVREEGCSKCQSCGWSAC